MTTKTTQPNTIDHGDKRSYFGSRLAFYFAAIGFAVGYGNVWRFPSLAYEYGGGAFFIPYLLAIVLIGIPLLFLELVLGQVYQRGNISAFAVCHKRMRGVGVASIASNFMVSFFLSELLVFIILNQVKHQKILTTKLNLIHSSTFF